MAKRKETKYIVVHCSATRGSQDIGAKEIRRWHKDRGWRDIGYHLVIRRDGRVELGRDLNDQGAHVSGHNSHSVGVCMVGGLAEDGSSDFLNDGGFTVNQKASLKDVLRFLIQVYPEAEILGHRDLSPDKDGDGEIERFEWVKDCPVMDVGEYLEEYSV